MSRTISWFSCGAASAVATKLVPDAIPAYCETGAEHSDNVRFMADCGVWFGRPVERLRSDTYTDTWDVWERTRWLAGVNGARCTIELKVAPRLAWQRPDDIHVFGYTADGPDNDRANRLRDNFPELTIVTPLIERGITKASCLDMVQRAGIKLPPLYALGFQNNNCLPCVKATSPAYWALVRQHFPDKFDRMAKLSRELDVRLCRLNDVRSFIDEIPLDQETTNPLVPACDFLCHIAEQDMKMSVHHTFEYPKTDPDRIKALREALDRIADIEPWKRGAASRMNRIARDALREDRTEVTDER